MPCLTEFAATECAHGDELQLQSLDFDNSAEDSTGSVVLSFVDSLRRVFLKSGTGRKCELHLTMPVLYAPDPYNIFELKMETRRRFRAAGSFLKLIQRSRSPSCASLWAVRPSFLLRTYDGHSSHLVQPGPGRFPFEVDSVQYFHVALV